VDAGLGKGTPADALGGRKAVAPRRARRRAGSARRGCRNRQRRRGPPRHHSRLGPVPSLVKRS